MDGFCGIRVRTGRIDEIYPESPTAGEGEDVPGRAKEHLTSVRDHSVRVLESSALDIIVSCMCKCIPSGACPLRVCTGVFTHGSAFVR